MRLDCPRCGTALEFSNVAPRFCSHCGLPLSGEVQTEPPPSPAEASTLPGHEPFDPLATHPYLMPGRPRHHPGCIGRYRLERMLGSGGMGTVFEAVEDASGRRVALKLIRPEYTDSVDAVERFRREGRLASTLFHPRCVFVLAADEENGQPYIVMELMPGKNLHDLVQERGPMSVDEAITKILDVIEGLQEAHRLGVIHRDVKPSNCFLDEEGRVKVGDFGLAKSVVRPDQITRSGSSFLGTVWFASPEQIRNEAVDAQTDVYSVCATLFFLLTGRAPFQDDDPTAALARAVSDPPPSLRSLRPDVPRTLDEVVLKGLSRTRKSRWQSLEELRLALIPFLGGPLIVPQPGWRVTAFVLDLFLLIPLTLIVQRMILWLEPASGTEMRNLVLSPLVGLVCGVGYFAIPEWLFGCSPGKYFTRLRVRDVTTMDRPSLPRSLWRTFLLYLLLDAVALVVGIVLLSIGAQVGNWILSERDVGVAFRLMGSVMLLATLPFLSHGVGLAFLSATMRRSNGYRGIHELLSGTHVISLPAEFPRFRAPAKAGWPTLHQLEKGVPLRVGTYDVLQAVRRTESEMLLQAQDTALHRPVWLWLRRAGELPPIRREIARDARPRWLTSGEQEDWKWDSFVGGAGCPLSDLVSRRKRLGWRDALLILEQLASELEEAELEGSLPERLSPEQVWVQPSGRVMLLDVPVREPNLVRTPMNLLRQAAAVVLEGQPRARGDLSIPIRAPIPWHASRVMDRLMGAYTDEEPFVNLQQAREALTRAHEHSEEISRPGRALQLGIMMGGLTPGILSLFGVGPLLLLVAYIICVLGTATADFAASQANRNLERLEKQGAFDLIDEQCQELEYIHQELTALENDRHVVLASWSWFVVKRLRQYEDRFEQAYVERLPTYLEIDDEEKQGLDFVLAKSDDLMVGPSTMLRDVLDEGWLPWLFLEWPLFWMLWSFATRGGVSYRLAGIALVGPEGRPAARWRCAVRSLLVWLPVSLLLLGAAYLDVWRVASSREDWSAEKIQLTAWLAWYLWWGAVLLLGGYLFVSIAWPNRGLHDRLTGVYPVPR